MSQVQILSPLPILKRKTDMASLLFLPDYAWYVNGILWKGEGAYVPLLMYMYFITSCSQLEHNKMGFIRDIYKITTTSWVPISGSTVPQMYQKYLKTP